MLIEKKKIAAALEELKELQNHLVLKSCTFGRNQYDFEEYVTSESSESSGGAQNRTNES